MTYPHQWPPQPPQHPQQWPPPYPPPPRSRRTKIVLLAVLAPVAIVILVVVGLIGYYVIDDLADGDRGGSREAHSLTDFNLVCDQGTISNAAALGRPYKIVAFTPDERPDPLSNAVADPWTEIRLDSRADYAVTSEDFLSVNVVACLSHKSGTEVKALTCDVKTKRGEQVSIDYYGVQYNIELREARTGKTIAQLGTVDGKADHCPFLLWVDQHNPKMYAEPEPAQVDAKLAQFAQGKQ